MSTRLPDDVLARRERLPLKPAPVVLEGRLARLEPLDVERHAPALFDCSNGSPVRVGQRAVGAYDAEALVWRYLWDGPFESFEPFAMRLAAQVAAPDGLCLCVTDIAGGRPVGVANFMSNYPAHLRIELGGIWYSPVAQRAGVNTEATCLMLGHAFGLGYRRVEWKCDALNERSRRAALRMGFRFEGTQDAHMIVKGRNRDTAWFRMLDAEWPDAKKHLEEMMSRR